MHRSNPAALAAFASLFLILGGLAPQASGGDSGPVTGRVTNGVTTQERPTTGALLSKSGINYSMSCSGTLIGCQTFLTAAHCVCVGSTFGSCGTPVPSQHAVFLQDVGLVNVSAIAVDPTYSFAVRGDVAVLTLSAPISGVSPTPINTAMRPPLGTSVEIAGYGLTQGGADDTGILRRGLAETATCTAADDNFHVCWAFTAPLGAPGIDSNTCNGDSGGPLFADIGSGETVVGLTSGGSSADCLPTDASYDSDVFVHRAFIQSVGGADLLNTSCGAISQVGEPATQRTLFSFDTLGKEQQACRKEISKQYNAYVSSALKAWQSCLNGVADGSRTAPCPDLKASGALTSAESKIRLDKLESRCPDSVAPSIGAAGDCAGALDAGDLYTCLLSASETAVADALASEYANDAPSGTLADESARGCQESVAKATGSLLKTGIKTVSKCQVSLASGKVTSCPDSKSGVRLTTADAKASDSILEKCSDANVVALDAASPFGGTCAGVTTSAALATCEVADHATVRDNLVGILADETMAMDVTFEVPVGTAVLRVNLNGRDNSSNDLDLFIRAGGPATSSLFDASSANGGMFEETEIVAPASGTWHVHLERFAGDDLIPYQLTATTFAP